MSAIIFRFPVREFVRVQHEPDGAWLVLTHRGHGWAHGGFHDALGDAREVARGLGAVVRSSAGEWRTL